MRSAITVVGLLEDEHTSTPTPKSAPKVHAANGNSSKRYSSQSGNILSAASSGSQRKLLARTRLKSRTTLETVDVCGGLESKTAAGGGGGSANAKAPLDAEVLGTWDPETFVERKKVERETKNMMVTIACVMRVLQESVRRQKRVESELKYTNQRLLHAEKENDALKLEVQRLRRQMEH